MEFDREERRVTGAAGAYFFGTFTLHTPPAPVPLWVCTSMDIGYIHTRYLGIIYLLRKTSMIVYLCETEVPITP